MTVANCRTASVRDIRSRAVRTNVVSARQAVSSGFRRARSDLLGTEFPGPAWQALLVAGGQPEFVELPPQLEEPFASRGASFLRQLYGPGHQLLNL